MELSFYLYLALFLAASLLSLGFSRLLPLSLAAGALSALVVSLLADSLLLELLLLFGVLAVSAALLLLLPHRRQSSLEGMVGCTCTVTERIDAANGGQVRLGDGLWAARALVPDTEYEAGAELTVVAIEGVKLICR